MHLLSSNSKLEKPVLLNGKPCNIAGLYIAPHAKGGHNVCGEATVGCIQACNLWEAGRTVMPNVRDAALRRKELLFSDPQRFYALLRADLISHQAACEKAGALPFARLNVASDLDWLWLAQEFSGIRFYDYSKIRNRVLGVWPSNYTLVYSWNERSTPEFARDLLAMGRNIAMVFDVPYNPQHKWYGLLPSSVSFAGHVVEVVDGDRHDVRIPELDGRGVVVGLRLKGSNRSKQIARDSGFAVKVPFLKLQSPTLGTFHDDCLVVA